MKNTLELLLFAKLEQEDITYLGYKLLSLHRQNAAAEYSD